MNTAAPASTPEPSPPAVRGCASALIGAVLVLVGIPMLICPGPGTATVMVGLGLIAAGLGLSRRSKA